MKGRELYDKWCDCIYLRSGELPPHWQRLTEERRAAWNDLAEQVAK